MTYLDRKQVEQLLRPINPSRVLKKQNQSHLEAYDVRAHLNRIFGFARWSGDVIKMTLVSQVEGTNKSGKPAVTVVYRAGYRLSIRAIDGEPLATYTEYASGDAINFPLNQLGDAHDFAMKTAESQALKRAAHNLGDQFGLSLYNNGSYGPLVIGTLATPDAGASDQGVDDEAPQITAEPEPEDVSQEFPEHDAAATALNQARRDQPDWDALLERSRNDRNLLLDLLAKAEGMGAPQEVKDRITAAGKALQARAA